MHIAVSEEHFADVKRVPNTRIERDSESAFSVEIHKIILYRMRNRNQSLTLHEAVPLLDPGSVRHSSIISSITKLKQGYRATLTNCTNYRKVRGNFPYALTLPHEVLLPF